jgi:beta-lactamase superfamily II metal-dependent hydrolase
LKSWLRQEAASTHSALDEVDRTEGEVFRVEMLPAEHGDCLWISYGSSDKPHHVLIDGGPSWTYPALRERILELPASRRELELLVVTHVDADHIGGILELLSDRDLRLTIKEIWFNAWRHLDPADRDVLGPVQGEMLTALILRQKLAWNAAFGGGPVAVPPSGELPRAELPGGLRLVLLSPTPKGLSRLRPKWEREVRQAGMEPGSVADAREELRRRRSKDLLGSRPVTNVRDLAASPFSEDEAAANRSSIAFFAEYRGRRCLMAGDAHPAVVTAGVRRYRQELGTASLTTDALKLSHHGSKGNTSPELLKLLNTRAYLFSTSGAIFKHPDAETVARAILQGGPGTNLFFNYRSEETSLWDDPRLLKKFSYFPIYPNEGLGGLLIEL